MEPVPERILTACRACGRQYDVTALATGSRVRCECGGLLEVERPRPRMPAPLRCGNCGAPLGLDAAACGYCDAEVTLEERKLSGVCPLCFCRIACDAHFCMQCGSPIRPQALRALPETAKCPRCRGELRSRMVADSAFVECSGCGGLWLGENEIDSICERTDHESLVRQQLAAQAPANPVPPTSGPAYLPCPVCTDRMVRRNFGGCSGVLIDVCRGHGVWLDHRELERILDFVRGGGLQRAREKEVARLKSEAQRARDSTLAGSGGSGGWVESESGWETSSGTDLLDVLRWIGGHIRRRAAS